LSKFTAEEKLQAFQRYLNGNESYKEIEQSIGVNKKSIFIWVKQYEHNGLNAFIKRCTNYTQQFKLGVLNFMIENGTSLTETAATFNIPAPSTVLVWRRQLETQGLNVPRIIEIV